MYYLNYLNNNQFLHYKDIFYINEYIMINVLCLYRFTYLYCCIIKL